MAGCVVQTHLCTAVTYVAGPLHQLCYATHSAVYSRVQVRLTRLKGLEFDIYLVVKVQFCGKL